MQRDQKADMYWLRGRIYHISHQFDKAKADLTKAIELRPLGEVYHSDLEFVEKIEKKLEQDPVMKNLYKLKSPYSVQQLKIWLRNQNLNERDRRRKMEDPHGNNVPDDACYCAVYAVWRGLIWTNIDGMQKDIEKVITIIRQPPLKYLTSLTENRFLLLHLAISAASGRGDFPPETLASLRKIKEIADATNTDFKELVMYLLINQCSQNTALLEELVL